MTPTDTVPMSSVPLQFLVQVFTSTTANCSVSPKFVGITREAGSCVGVPFNTTFHEPIIAEATEFARFEMSVHT